MGLHREVGLLRAGGGTPCLFRDLAPQSPQRLSEDRPRARWGAEDRGTGQPGLSFHSSTGTTLVPRSPPPHPPQISFSLHPRPQLPLPRTAQPAGWLLLDAQRSSQPSETRRGPSAPPRPHSALDGHSGQPPTHVSFQPDCSRAPHKRLSEPHPLPSLTSSQRSWPRKLSSRVLCMPVPEPPPGLPVALRTPAGAVR